MKKEIKKEGAWNFVIKNESPSENIKRLVEQLSISKLVLYTQQALKQKHNHKFKLTRISMAGTARYVDDKLYEIYLSLKKALDSYIKSDESIVNKKYELYLSSNLLYEAILLNNEDVEFNQKANELMLCNEKSNESKKITINEICSQPEIAEEMTAHLLVRQKYLNMLGNYFRTLKERVELFEIEPGTIEIESNSSKEIELLEIWLGLVNENFFTGYKKNALAKKRSQFFAVFDLKDRDYNVRHRDLKNKKTLGVFTKNMSKNLRIKYKFDVPPKKGLK
jgi:hypothetical protein